MKKKYRYLFWDIDGTILNFLAAEKEAIKTLFKRFNLGECSDEMISQYSSINVKYWQKLERGEMKKSEILINRFIEFFSFYNLDTTLAKDFNDAYQITLGDTIVFNDDAFNLLCKLKKYYKLIAVTNGTKIAQNKKLNISHLIDVFDDIFISEEVGYEKPSILYFHYIFKKLNIINKKEVLIIGDSLTSDIKGGNNAGIDTCWYNPNAKKSDQNVTIDYEINDLHDLLKFL